MKSSCIALVVGICALVPWVLRADTVEIITNQGPYQFSDSGEFVVQTTPNNFLSGYAPTAKYDGGFATFAADSDIKITYNTSYNYTLSQTDSDGKPLTQGAALLYYDFSQGILPDYAFTGSSYDRIQDAGLLQTAIWAFEGYTNPAPQYPVGNLTNVFYDYALSVDPNALLPNNGLYDVSIMDLSGANGPAQNLLVAQVNTAPDGATTSILLAGSVGLLLLARKLKTIRI